MVRPQYVKLKEFPGWWLSSSGIVTKEPGNLKKAKIPEDRPGGFCYRFMTEKGMSYEKITKLIKKYFPEHSRIKKDSLRSLRARVIKYAPNYKKNLQRNEPSTYKKKSRRCVDCGKPTPDYRCPECWKKLRETGGYETSAPGTTYGAPRCALI